MLPATSCLQGDKTAMRSCHHHHGAATMAYAAPMHPTALAARQRTAPPHALPHHRTPPPQCGVGATHGGCRNTRPIAVGEADSREKILTGKRLRRWPIVRGARFWRFCNNLCNVPPRRFNASPPSNALRWDTYIGSQRPHPSLLASLGSLEERGGELAVTVPWHP